MRPHRGQLHHKWQRRHNPRNTRLQLTCSSWLAKRKTHKVRKHEDTHSNICYAFGGKLCDFSNPKTDESSGFSFWREADMWLELGESWRQTRKTTLPWYTSATWEIYRNFQNVHSSYSGRCNGWLLAPTINWRQYRVTVNFFRGTAAVRHSGRFSI